MTAQAVRSTARADVRALFDGRPGGVSIAAEPVHGILTCSLPGGLASTGERIEPLLVKVPTGPVAAHAVQQEARLLVELRRMRLGPVERTIPRHVGMRSFDGLPVAVSSTVPGRPMEQRRWLHTAQPWLVRRDFQHAASWLAAFQDASSTSPSRSTWVSDAADAVRARWQGHPQLGPALSRLGPSAERLDGCLVDRTAVHGDFWYRNVLVDPARTAVTGVVNWTAGELAGSPLRDLARFAIRYSFDPRAHPGPPLPARAGFRPAADPATASLALLGRGWYPRTVRAYLGEGLDRLGVPRDRWYDVVLAGLGEIAAQDRDETAAEGHLALLARLPAAPGRSAGWL